MPTPTNVDRGDIDMLTDQTVDMAIAAKDEDGTVHAFPGAGYTWTSSDTGVATVGAGADEWSKVITAVAPGTTMILIENVATGKTESVNISVRDQRPGEIGLTYEPPIGP